MNSTLRPESGTVARNQYGTFEVHAASAAQSRFLDRLLAERNTSGLSGTNLDLVRTAIERSDTGSVSKRLASDVITVLLACPVIPGTEQPASDKQLAFLYSLADQRDWSGLPDPDGTLEWLFAGILTPGRKQASGLIDALLNAPRKTVAAQFGEQDAGMWIDMYLNRIFKVYKAVHGSGKMCAKVLVVDDFGQSSFDYLGLAERHVPKGAHRMSLEDAKHYGRLYGVCVRCGATLTDEASIEAGIGPICATKGWGA